MDAGILQALKTVKSSPYVQYVGLGLAALVTQKEHRDPTTGEPLRKTKLQLVRISAAVCGIELCYAAETAFVSPILLKLGVPISLMTLTWCLSPLLGFFLVPFMGSLSDRCRLRFGRRRPFIILMSVGIILGLGLVPNGEILGILLGDCQNEVLESGSEPVDALTDMNQTETVSNSTASTSFPYPSGHFRGIIFTIVGVALLDFNCDACQSPCRAYLLDVSVPDDHPTGLTTFTVMAGAGGSIGYIMGGIDWNSTHFGEALGGHIRVVFSIVLIAFIVCVIFTLTSFRETPLSEMSITNQDLQSGKNKVGSSKYRKFTNEDSSSDDHEANEVVILDKELKTTSYGTLSGKADIQPYTAKATEFHLQRNSPTQADRLPDTQNGRAVMTDKGSAHGQTTKKPFVDGFIFQTSRGESRQMFKMQNGQMANRNSQLLGDEKPEEFVGGFSQTIDQQEQLNSGHPCPPVGLRKNYPESLQDEITKRGQNVLLERPSVTSPETKQMSDEISLYNKYNTDYNCTKEDMVAGRKVQVSTDVTLKTYLLSIVKMPRSMWVLCLCNLLCWMSLVCYSLYFTDFVGQSVFGGSPQAPVGSDLHNRYDAGVRLGSLGMSLYSLACACYSLTIERLVQRFRAKRVYMVGQLVFTVGMAGMAVSRSKAAVILLSPTAGIMYATLFTMPYLLVAHYHTRGLFSQEDAGSGDTKQVRGLGTDVAIISSMVFLAQFLLSLMIGSLVVAMGSPVIVILTSCVLSFMGSMTASQITYLDL